MGPENSFLDPMIREIREKGELSKRYTVQAAIQLRPEVFVPGTYRAWLPLPLEDAQQSDVLVEEGDPTAVAPADAPARSAFWERYLEKWEDFTLRYSFTSRICYADPLGRKAPASPLYPASGDPRPEDLAEDPPFLRFTPFLRALAAEWVGEEKDPVRKEALLFIALCRLSGIPARWQSGLSMDEDNIGCHDWAQFWLPGWGWLFADPSYGGSAWQRGAAERHRFYFGNLDPARIAANRVFEADRRGAALRSL